ncbi:hypothetical protein Tco_1531415 [Tanacetum coccineum]
MWRPYSQSQQKCLDVCKRKAGQPTKSWARLLRLQVQKGAERCCLDAVFVQKDSEMCCLVPKVAERCCLDVGFVQKVNERCCLVENVAESCCMDAVLCRNKLLKGVVRIWPPLAVVLKL